MNNQDFQELSRYFGKEVMAEMIKADIRSRVPEPWASIYCKQFDDFKNLADFLEFMSKVMRGQ